MDAMIDGFGRRISYLRLSVTDRCDLRCSYCMPERFRGYKEPESWLSFDEIIRLAGVFAQQGLKRIRLTGGEPLVRRDLPVLAGRLRDIAGIEDLSLSTNGTRLQQFAGALRRAGVTRLNVSLDSLDRDRVRTISRRDVLPVILAGLAVARSEDFALIKINMVLLPETADSEIDAMADFCIEQGFVLRMIETMPVGESGHGAGFRNLQPVRERLRRRYGLVDGIVPGSGPARYLVSADRGLQIGFITPISQHFCGSCNRVRLTVDGTMHLCLGQEENVDFRMLLRTGAGDEDIAAALRAGMQRKPERHEFVEHPRQIVRFMSSTGG